MSEYHLAVEYHNDQVVMVHWIKGLRPGDDGFYRHATSINGFHNRCLNRFMKERTNRHKQGYTWPALFFNFKYRHEVCEETLYQQMVARAWNYCQNVAYYENVFDFYEAVGIDYKRDKWPTLEQRKESM